MAAEVPFSEILTLLESHGWKRQRIVKPCRVFTAGCALSILIPVHGKMVSTAYADKIEKILRAESEGDESD